MLGGTFLGKNKRIRRWNEASTKHKSGHGSLRPASSVASLCLWSNDRTCAQPASPDTGLPPPRLHLDPQCFLSPVTPHWGGGQVAGGTVPCSGEKTRAASLSPLAARGLRVGGETGQHLPTSETDASQGQSWDPSCLHLWLVCPHCAWQHGSGYGSGRAGAMELW